MTNLKSLAQLFSRCFIREVAPLKHPCPAAGFLDTAYKKAFENNQQSHDREAEFCSQQSETRCHNVIGWKGAKGPSGSNGGDAT